MKPLLAAAALLTGLLVQGLAVADVPENAVWIDVRTPEEFAAGHLEGAVNVPHERIEAGVEALGLEPDTPIYLYCRSGRRSGIAAEALAGRGFRHLTNAGGLDEARALFNADPGSAP